MDPYVYPGTNVLKNLRDLRDLETLAEFEATSTRWRSEQLQRRKQPGKFDIAHLKAIHGYIFQDVYEWAGQLRTVEIARPGQFPFAFVQRIQPSLQTLLETLGKEQHLKGLDLPAFSRRAGHYMGELNAIHPFRDGNGRTQREFIRQLALRGSFVVNWSRITRPRMGDASHLSFQKADNSGLADLILQSIQ